MSLPQPVKKSCHFHDSMQRIRNILFNIYIYLPTAKKKSIYKLFQYVHSIAEVLRNVSKS